MTLDVLLPHRTILIYCFAPLPHLTINWALFILYSLCFWFRCVLYLNPSISACIYIIQSTHIARPITVLINSISNNTGHPKHIHTRTGVSLSPEIHICTMYVLSSWHTFARFIFHTIVFVTGAAAPTQKKRFKYYVHSAKHCKITGVGRIGRL